MKKLIFSSTLFIMTLFIQAQNTVYNKDGTKSKFTSEDIDILFETNGIQKSGAEAGAILSILPTVVDVAFGLTTKALENKVKKFTAEYSKKKSHLNAASGIIPNFKFERKVTIRGNESTALSISFEAYEVSGINGFIYYVKSIELNYSAAKFKSSSNNLDYVIEIKPTLLLENGESQTLESGDIVISSVKFETKNFTDKKYRSNIMSIPEGAVLTGINIKIVETNPSKTRAEKVLSIWNDNKENVKTIVKEFIPKEEEEADSTGNSDEENNNENDGNNDSDGNE